MQNKLILVRHGQSQYNLENRFTGWLDVPLTEVGKSEAQKAGEFLKRLNFQPDIAYTSDLSRAQKTLELIQSTISYYGPVIKNKALNERHYGQLQGKNKAETAQEFGEDQVHIWRRSFDVPPPGGESLKDTAARTLPYFRAGILPKLKEGKNVLIVAHGNSLRSIVMEIESMSPEQILKTEIATGEPRIYKLENRDSNIHFVKNL